MSYQVRIGYQIDTGMYGVWLTEKQPNGEIHALSENGAVVRSLGEEIPEATWLDKEQLSVLMDDLWATGIRPNGYAREGEIGAVRDHLEDMRKLVFRGD